MHNIDNLSVQTLQDGLIPCSVPRNCCVSDKKDQLAIHFQKFYSKLLMDYWSIFENIFSSLFSDVDKASQIKSFWIHSDIMDSKYMYVDLNLKIP